MNADRLILKTRSGFSLLEMMMTLFILALLAGAAAFSVRNVFRDEDLRQASLHLQLMAQTARHNAIRDGSPWEILMLAGVWRLQPSEAAEENSPSATEYKPSASIHWNVQPGPGAEWKKDQAFLWSFQPNGMSPPHRFRFVRDDSFIELSFHPLTAQPFNEEFNLP